MAPLVQAAIQFLLGSSRFNSPCLQGVEEKSVASTSPSLNSLSTISWGPDRVDTFGSDPDGSVVHKFWDGSQWQPSEGLENLGGDLFTSPPTALSWGPNRIDIFNVGKEQSLYHKYWDGTAWKPDGGIWENFGGNLVSSFAVAVTSWGENRLDVFSVGPDRDGRHALWHKYWDGSSWNPSEDLEHLGGDFISGIAAVSWGPDRIDLAAVARNGDLMYRCWNGIRWVEWEKLGEGFGSTPTVASWGKDRFDIFAVKSDSNLLYHKALDGGKWSDWENLGGPFQGAISVTSWKTHHFDVVGLGLDKTYLFKWFDGTKWNPSVSGWLSKKGDFVSAPSTAKWAESRLDIFGIGSDQGLWHQAHNETAWDPSFDSYIDLGGPVKAYTEAPQAAMINPEGHHLIGHPAL